MCGQTCICLPLAWHPDTYTCCSGLIVLLPSVRRHPCHGEEPAAQYKRMFGETRRKLALPGFLSMKHMFLYCCPCYQEAGVCLLPISFSNCGKNRQEKSQRVESAHLICFGTYWLVSCQAFWFLYFSFKASKVRCWHWLTWLIAVCRDLRAACVSSLLSCTHFLRPWIWVISIYVCVPCKTVHSRQVTNWIFFVWILRCFSKWVLWPAALTSPGSLPGMKENIRFCSLLNSLNGLCTSRRPSPFTKRDVSMCNKRCCTPQWQSQ